MNEADARLAYVRARFFEETGMTADLDQDLETVAALAGDDTDNRGRRRLAALLVFLGIAAIVLWLFLSQTSIVPDVVGLAEKDAREALADAGYAIGEVTTSADTRVEPGEVSAQSPASGSRTLKGVQVDLTVREGGAAGGTTGGEDGTSASEETGYDYSYDYTPASVTDKDSSYSDTPIDYGPQVPPVQNLTQAEAIAKLEAAGYGYKIGGYGPSTAGVLSGRVYYQNPAPETYADAGTTVVIWISTGGPRSNGNNGWPYPTPE